MNELFDQLFMNNQKYIHKNSFFAMQNLKKKTDQKGAKDVIKNFISI